MKCSSRKTRIRAGSVLVVAMIVTMSLAASVLVLCRTVRVESMAAANRAATMQVDAIARGAEQYVLAMITSEEENALDLSEDQFAAVPVGDGYFWVLRPSYDDDIPRPFGLVDEASKFNVTYQDQDDDDDDVGIMPNYTADVHIQRMMRLPGMTDDVAAAIVDWQDGDNETMAEGAESEYYTTLAEPYVSKNDRLETLEELLLVRGVNRQMLYGDGNAPPLGERTSVLRDGSFTTDAQLARGWFDLITVYSRERRNQPPRNRRETLRGLINVRSAPRAVLACVEGLGEAEIDKLIAARSETNAGETLWVQEALGPAKYAEVAGQLTTRTFQYSADILAVTASGRAFKRVRIVIDVNARNGTLRINYRRDITDRGWPMDKRVLASLRAGNGPGSAAIGMRSMGGGI